VNYHTVNAPNLHIASPGPQGAKGDPGQGTTVQTMTFTGELSVVLAKPRFYMTREVNITALAVSVGTAPVGADLIVDIYRNGLSIFATPEHRPTITDGSHLALATVPDNATLAVGDYLTVSIDQVGLSLAGSDLTVQIELTQVEET
jgi:hypothetical protein